MGDQFEEDASDLQRIGPATAQQDAEEKSEFVSRDLDLWAYTRGVTLDFSRPGKPTDNAFIEALNGRLLKATASSSSALRGLTKQKPT